MPVMLKQLRYSSWNFNAQVYAMDIEILMPNGHNQLYAK